MNFIEACDKKKAEGNRQCCVTMYKPFRKRRRVSARTMTLRTFKIVNKRILAVNLNYYVAVNVG